MSTGHSVRRVSIAVVLLVVALGPAAPLAAGASPTADRPVAPQASTPTPTGTPTGPAPAFELSVETSGDRVAAGDEFTVTVEVRNVGEEVGTKGVEFEAEGRQVDARDVTVAPGNSRTIEFTHTFTEGGNQTIEIDRSIRRTVFVEGGTQTPTPSETAPAFNLSVETSADRVKVSDPFSVTVTVENVGNESGTKGVEFEAEGRQVDARDVTVAPGASRTIQFDYRFTEAGNQTIEIDYSIRRTVVVEPLRPNISIESVAVDRNRVQVSEPVRITATVTNDGRANGTARVPLRLFGEVVDVRTVRVAPGESAEVVFTRRIRQPGTYTASVGDRTVRIRVVGADTATSTPTRTTTPRAGAAPGFGVVAAVTALAALVGALALGRRRDR